MRGNSEGDWIEAQAKIIEDAAEEKKMRQRLAAKYGWQYRLFSILGALRGRDSQQVVLEISDNPQGETG